MSEQLYQNKHGQRYQKEILSTGQTWWSIEREKDEFYIISGKPSEDVFLIKHDCYVFDLDGTLFDNSPREHLVPEDPSCTENWTEWNRACELDMVLEPVATIARTLGDAGNEVRYVTSRCTDGLVETINAIVKAKLPMGYLHMRRIGDNRSHVDVKIDLFAELSETNTVVAAFEDQQDNVDALSALGYFMVKV